MKYNFFQQNISIISLSIIWDKCGSNDDKIFKKEESIETLKTLGLINNNDNNYYYYNMNK